MSIHLLKSCTSQPFVYWKALIGSNISSGPALFEETNQSSGTEYNIVFLKSNLCHHKMYIRLSYL